MSPVHTSHGSTPIHHASYWRYRALPPTVPCTPPTDPHVFHRAVTPPRETCPIARSATRSPPTPTPRGPPKRSRRCRREQTDEDAKPGKFWGAASGCDGRVTADTADPQPYLDRASQPSAPGPPGGVDGPPRFLRPTRQFRPALRFAEHQLLPQDVTVCLAHLARLRLRTGPHRLLQAVSTAVPWAFSTPMAVRKYRAPYHTCTTDTTVILTSSCYNEAVICTLLSS